MYIIVMGLLLLYHISVSCWWL